MRTSKSLTCAAALAALSALALATVSAAAHPLTGARSAAVSFSGLPAEVFQGQRVTFKVMVSPSSKSCTLLVRYSGGRKQSLAPKSAARGTASWTFRVPPAPPGLATLKASCSGSGLATAQVQVRWALEVPKLTVVNRGFSQRSQPSGSDVNFGLAIQNERTHWDASGVAILVNLVDSTNRILGSLHLSKSRIPAASTIYLGAQTRLPTQTPVARLEVVFVSARSTEPEPATPLLISDVILAPDSKGFLSSIRGQVLNNYSAQLQSADVGVLFEDANGNVIGGGSGTAGGPLSLGAREAFGLGYGFSAIPSAQIASTLFSTVPSYAVPRG